MGLSENEKYDILRIYLKNNKNAVASQREYRRLYDDRVVPCRNTFRNVHRSFETTKTLKRKRRVVVRDENEELNVLLYFQEHPNRSIRDARRDLEISLGKIWNILHKHKVRPFKLLPVSRLTQANVNARLEFCQLMIDRLDNDQLFFNKILWTDEASFTTSGIFNRRNSHFWSFENPHQIKDIQFQGRQAISVWCGIYNNRVLGPIIYRQPLTGERFLNFLQNDIEYYLEDLPLIDYNQIIWHQDGAPPHTTIAVRNYLNNRFHEWIGKHGTIRWPPNSPDLSLLDTFLWGYLKNKCYQERTENIEELQQRIIQHIFNLNNNAQNFILNSIGNLKKRYRLCLENHGNHFEQFL